MRGRHHGHGKNPRLGEGQLRPSSATKRLCELEEDGRGKSASVLALVFLLFPDVHVFFPTSWGPLYFYQDWGKWAENWREGKVLEDEDLIENLLKRKHDRDTC